jgi:lysophospholipase L1-like esterase
VSEQVEALIDRHRLVVLGDSFSCGVGVGVVVAPERTWVGLLGAALGMHIDLLASPGLASAEVAHAQLPCALDRPGTIATVFVGLNDVVRSAFDPDATHAHIATIVGELGACHDVVLVVLLHDAMARLPLPRAIRRRYGARLDAVNAALAAASANCANAVPLDLAAVPALRARCAWAVDRIHLSEYGHHAVATAGLRALRMREAAVSIVSAVPTVPTVLTVPTATVAPMPIPDAAAGKLAELRWFVTHGAPWLASRLPKVVVGRVDDGTGVDQLRRVGEGAGMSAVELPAVQVRAVEPGRGSAMAGREQLVHR